MNKGNDYIRKYKKYEPLFGNWYFKKFIGAGGFAQVFEVYRKDFGKEYSSALKIIAISMSPSEIKERQTQGMTSGEIKNDLQSLVNDTVNEIQLMYDLKGCGNIVAYEDHEVKTNEDGVSYDILIKMELLTPLDDYLINKHGTLPLKSIIKLGVDVCKALEVCKKHNIIHRDIKFENIFISQDGDYKLGDFGVARILEKKDIGLSKKGTATYMAPEVYRGAEYGAEVDIYGLGMVLYRLLNHGRAPFLPEYPNPISFDERDKAMARRMQGEIVPAPQGIDCKSLVDVVLKACAYDPKNRYCDPTEMKKDLETLMTDTDDREVFVYQVENAESNITSDETEILNEDATEILYKDTTEALRENDSSHYHLKRDKSTVKSSKKMIRMVTAVVAGVLVLGAGGFFIASRSQNKDDVKIEDIPEDNTTVNNIPVEELYEEANTYFVEGKYEDAFQSYLEAADAGHGASMFEVGECYYYGTGVDIDYNKAFSYLEGAAENGEESSWYLLGLCYYEGNGTTQNYDMAYQYMQKASGTGNEEAGEYLTPENMYMIAEHYAGIGGEEGDNLAFQYNKMAAEAGNVDAMNNVGYAFSKGKGVEENNEAAFEWYKKAADNGNATAMYNTAVMYQSGNGVDQNYDLAFEYHMKANEAGYEASAQYLTVDYMYTIATSYDSIGGEAADVLAFKYYKMAAENGHLEAMNSVGYAYSHGKGVTENKQKAFEWYKKAADSGHAAAMYNTAVMYQTGTGVSFDYEKAFEYHAKAVEAGCQESAKYTTAEYMYTIGMNYMNGSNGVSQNSTKAYNWILKAADSGNADAMYVVAYYFYMGHMDNGKWQDYDTAEKYLKNAQAAGQSEAGNALNTLANLRKVWVTAVTINNAWLGLTEGQSSTLTATVSPSNATNQSVTWTSDNNAVATVSGGKVTAISAGTATITATADGKSATCTVTVNPAKIAVVGVSLSKTSIALTEGECSTLTATVSPSNATNQSVTWTSDNNAVATVSGGKVTAISAGTATITATADGKSATCTVTVKASKIPVTSISISQSSLKLEEGTCSTLTAKVSPSNATSPKVTWASSDPSVASVSDGKVTAVSSGTATITATADGKSATCKVTVESAIETVSNKSYTIVTSVYSMCVTYTGEWKDGAPHGYGVATTTKAVSGRFDVGDTLAGNWVNGLLQGQGTYTSRDGSFQLVGTFVDGLKEGTVYVYQNGTPNGTMWFVNGSPT